MKKILLSVLMLGSFVAAKSQLIYLEDFNDEEISDWTILDTDDDDVSWEIIQYVDDDDNPVRTPMLVSASYINNFGPLTPDNVAISPAISLSAYDGSTPLKIGWDVYAIDEDYDHEKYAVFVSTSNNLETLLASEVTFEEYVDDNGATGLENPYFKSLDITSFHGQTIYIAFRHFDSTDEYAMGIDNVMVYAGETAPVVGVSQNTIKNFSHFYNVQAKTLHLSATQEFSHINVYSVIGQEMMNQKLYNTNEVIDLSKLSTGVYFFNIQSQGQKTTLKIAVK